MYCGIITLLFFSSVTGLFAQGIGPDRKILIDHISKNETANAINILRSQPESDRSVASKAVLRALERASGEHRPAAYRLADRADALNVLGDCPAAKRFYKRSFGSLDLKDSNREHDLLAERRFLASRIAERSASCSIGEIVIGGKYLPEKKRTAIKNLNRGSQDAAVRIEFVRDLWSVDDEVSWFGLERFVNATFDKPVTREQTKQLLVQLLIAARATKNMDLIQHATERLVNAFGNEDFVNDAVSSLVRDLDEQQMSVKADVWREWLRKNPHPRPIVIN